ncbi:MAG: winged helix-turn-helix domain-containing protein [Pyramidobacter sp.]|nr:winged helix-turn-helix domain-containing protein [Pyramidobacter sp.]
MSKKKKPFQLGKDVEAALAQIVSINSDEPAAEAPAPVTAERPAAASAPGIDPALLVWYGAMKPRTMSKFVWMILFRWQASRTGGVIVIDELAELLGQKRENVARALNDLTKAGWIKTLGTTKGERGKIVSKRIALVTEKK